MHKHGDVIIEIVVATSVDVSHANLRCKEQVIGVSDHLTLEEAKLRLHAAEWSFLSGTEPNHIEQAWVRISIRLIMVLIYFLTPIKHGPTSFCFLGGSAASFLFF